MNFYPNYNNPYYGSQTQPQMSRFQPIEQQYPQYSQQPVSQPVYKQPTGLQGKSVDSLEVVKAMDIPLDGSISYFPLTDGSAIITKQLQPDGTSKTIIYKPIEGEVNEKLPKYVTLEELDEKIKNIDNKDLKDEIKNLKKQIKDITAELRELNDDGKDD